MRASAARLPVAGWAGAALGQWRPAVPLAAWPTEPEERVDEAARRPTACAGLRPPRWWAAERCSSRRSAPHEGAGQLALAQRSQRRVDESPASCRESSAGRGRRRRPFCRHLHRGSRLARPPAGLLRAVPCTDVRMRRRAPARESARANFGPKLFEGRRGASTHCRGGAAAAAAPSWRHAQHFRSIMHDRGLWLSGAVEHNTGRRSEYFGSTNQKKSGMRRI